MINSKMFVWCKNHPQVHLVSTPSVGKKEWSCQLSAFQSLPCQVREESVWSLLPLKLLCSAAKLYQHGILPLHFSPSPSHPLFQDFCRLWLCKRSWNPFGLQHFMCSCWETNAAAQGSCWRKSSLWSLFWTRGILSKICFPVLICPVLGICPCYTVHAACTWSSCSGTVIHSKKGKLMWIVKKKLRRPGGCFKGRLGGKAVVSSE